LEDSDDWISIDVEEFDRMLETKGARPMDVDGRVTEEGAAQSEAKNLQSLADKVQDFVEGEGTLKGAKFTE
jgi:hypothetical protein